MSKAFPVYYRWSGETMDPLPRFKHRADDQFVVGEVYRLQAEEERSATSHAHFFAVLNEAYKNLPENLADRFANPDHLRRWCLIKSGYCDKRSIVCQTMTDAQRVAAFAAQLDEFAVVLVEGAVVSVFTAKSQSIKSMDRQTFQASKQDVLELVAGMIGVTPAALAAEARKQGHRDEPETDPDSGRSTTPAGNAPGSSVVASEVGAPTHAGTQAEKLTGEAESGTPSPKPRAKKAPKAEAGSQAGDSSPQGATQAPTETPAILTRDTIKDADDYRRYAEAWIDADQEHQARVQGRWDDEMDLRQCLKVPVMIRSKLQARIDRKFSK